MLQVEGKECAEPWRPKRTWGAQNTKSTMLVEITWMGIVDDAVKGESSEQVTMGPKTMKRNWISF